MHFREGEALTLPLLNLKSDPIGICVVRPYEPIHAFVHVLDIVTLNG